MKRHEITALPLDDQFAILLHKKLMNKTGACKRRTLQRKFRKRQKDGRQETPG
jgi:hypothetical protein